MIILPNTNSSSQYAATELGWTFVVLMLFKNTVENLMARGSERRIGKKRSPVGTMQYTVYCVYKDRSGCDDDDDDDKDVHVYIIVIIILYIHYTFV